MSIELKLEQLGKEKKEIPFDVICSGSLHYGYFDGMRLDVGSIGQDGFILFHPEHIARGISVEWTEGEKDLVIMRLQAPSCKEEIDDFFEIALRIHSYMNNCRIEMNGTRLSLYEFEAQREIIKKYNLRVLNEVGADDDAEPVLLFCAFWPLFWGLEEKKVFGLAKDLSVLRDYMHEKQSIEAYYAKPLFYEDEKGLIGIYAFTENTKSIFPNRPFVPFGIKDPATGQAPTISRWYVHFMSTTDNRSLGQTTYDDFIDKINHKSYYDAGNSIIEPFTKEEMQSLIERFGVTI